MINRQDTGSVDAFGTIKFSVHSSYVYHRKGRNQIKYACLRDYADDSRTSGSRI